MSDQETRILSVDPDRLEVPVDLPSPASDTGEVVFVVADEQAHESGWGRRAVVEVARAWSGAGCRLILADGDLEGAGLHPVVGAVNEEGLSDMILYGSSPGRASQRVAEESFLFISAGTVVHDPSEVYSHPRWQTLLSAFRESGSVLLVYLPEGGEGRGPVAGELDRVIRLASVRPLEEPDPGVHVLVVRTDGESPSDLDATVEEEPVPETTVEPALEFGDGFAEDLEPGDEVAEDLELGDEVAGEVDLESSPQGSAGLDVPDFGVDLVEAEVVEADSPEVETVDIDPVESETVEVVDSVGVESLEEDTWAPDPFATEGGEPEPGLETESKSEATEEPEPVASGEAETVEVVREEALAEGAPATSSVPEPDTVVTAPRAAPSKVGDGPIPDQRRTLSLLVLLIAVIVLVLVAAWLGYVDIPGIAAL